MHDYLDAMLIRARVEACTTDTACQLTSHQTLSLAACAEADASRPTEMAAVAKEAMASYSSVQVLRCSCWSGVTSMRNVTMANSTI